jgi:hypothetical protein
MSVIAELDAGELFDVDAVEVKEGIVQAAAAEPVLSLGRSQKGACDIT